jgi:hypothetical protein
MKTFPQIFSLFLKGCFFYFQTLHGSRLISSREWGFSSSRFPKTFEKHISAYLRGSFSTINKHLYNDCLCLPPNVAFPKQIDWGRYFIIIISRTEAVYYYFFITLYAGYLQYDTSNKPCFYGIQCCNCFVFTICITCNVISQVKCILYCDVSTSRNTCSVPNMAVFIVYYYYYYYYYYYTQYSGKYPNFSDCFEIQTFDFSGIFTLC